MKEVVVKRIDENKAFISPDELSVLQCIADGLTTRGIATKLEISLRTVEARRDRARKKSGAKSVLQLVLSLYKRGIIK